MDTAVAPAPAAAPKKSSEADGRPDGRDPGDRRDRPDQTLAQVDADVAQVVDAIRSRRRTAQATLKQQSDEDIAAIREWSRAEIARIKDETDARITTRKATLERRARRARRRRSTRRVDEVERAAVTAPRRP